MLEIHLLGECKVVHNGESVAAIHTSGRMQSLLAYLLLHAGQSLSRRHLAFIFWPDSSEKQALTNLRGQLHALRRGLPDADRFLAVDSATVAWQTDAPYSLDIHMFEDALAAASNPDDRVREALEQAVDLFRGDLLPGNYDEWILPERERLHQRYLDAVDDLVEVLEIAADYDAAIRYAQRAIHLDPLREDAYRRLMELHLLNGDRARALRVYHDCASMLERELGVEPDAQTMALHARLLKLDEQHDLAGFQAKRERPKSSLALIGRKAEWRQLLTLWRQSATGRCQMVVITGEAGIGKSRLAEELTTWASYQGIDTAQSRVYETASNLAYAPMLDWLRSATIHARLTQLEPVWLSEVGRLLPDIFTEFPELAQPAPLTENWQRHRLFEALARAFTTETQPLLLSLDDLQWCDAETIAWLEFLLRYAPDARLLVVATLRSEEVDSDHPLTPALQRLRQEATLTEILLGALDGASSEDLANQASGHEFSSAEMAQLQSDTQGNPLFVVEMARAWRERTSAEEVEQESSLEEESRARADIQSAPLPRKVQAVIQDRVARLSRPARQLCAVSAVVGHFLTFDLLAAATEMDQDSLVRSLDELWERKILREQQSGALDTVYDFSHDRIRDVAYAQLSPMRRQLLHRRVAQAIEKVFEHSLPEQSARLAAQWVAGGDAKRGRDYYRTAGERAASQFANDEAFHYFALALELTQGSEVEELFLLHRVRERLLHRTARRELQRAELDRMAELAIALDDDAARAQTAIASAQFAEALGDFELSEEAAKEAITRAGAAHRRDLEAQGTVQRGFVHWNRGAYPHARTEFERALELALSIDDRELEERILLHLGPVYIYCGSYAETVQISGQALTAARALGDRAGESWAHNQLAFAIVEQGDETYADAEAHYAAALSIAQEIGDRTLEAKVLTNSGVLYDRRGDYTKAIGYPKRSREFAHEVGALRQEAFAQGALATTLTNQGAFAQAEICFQDAWTLFRTIGYRQGEGKILGDLSFFWHLRGKDEGALADAGRALEIAQETGVARDQAYAWTRKGYAYEGLQRWTEAQAAYEAALAIFDSTGQHNRSLEPTAGLARLALAAGKTDRATRIVAHVVKHLLTHTLDATTEALQVYDTCHRILSIAQDERSQQLWRIAHDSVHRRAASIADPDRRRVFWDDVPLHQRFMHAPE